MPKVLIKFLLDLFYPPTCYNCSVFIRQGAVFCEKCLSLIKPVPEKIIAINERYSMSIHAASLYEEPVNKLILRKFASDRSATKALASIIVQFSDIKKIKTDCVIPIPLHWSRYAKRGFNQVDLLAEELSKELNVPVLNILERVKKTEFQSRLSSDEKKKNLQGAFRFSKKFNIKLLENKTVLLVDDLLTTGSTLKSAASLLSLAKPGSIVAVVGCRF